MADDPDPGLRKLLTDELADLAPKIRGFGDIALDQPQPSLEVSAISRDALAAVTDQLARTIHRRTLIQELLDGMDKVRSMLDDLKADGWPDPVKPAMATASVLQELQREQTDVQAAVTMFTQEQAASIAVTLGDPVPQA